jgi:AraC-like DNA-binding protein
MQTFSTDQLPAHERFDYWREVRAARIFGVTVELEAEKRPHFSGSFLAHPLGDSALVEMHASSYRVHRSESDIANAASDSLCIYQQIDGVGWFKTARDDEFVVGAGAIATSHSDLPYFTTPTTDAGFHLRIVKIPFSRCRTLVKAGVDLHARPLAVQPGVPALFATFLASFVAQAPHLAGAAAETAVQTLAQLALAARGLAEMRDEHGRAAIRNARLEEARQLIDRHLQRPDLAPATLAKMMGISVRHVHMLFEPTGTTCARYVVARRLERARLLLSQSAARPVGDVALACGFDSLSTFYRTFRSAYGMSPNDFRQTTIRKT